MKISREELIKKGMTDSDIDYILSYINSVFVACFSGDVSNQNQMWAYYANNHQELCFKYKVNNRKAIKSNSWKDENEFRLIIPKGDLAGTACGKT